MSVVKLNMYEITNQTAFDEFKQTIIERINPIDSFVSIQASVVEEIIGNIWAIVDKNDARNQIKEIKVLGSFAKGTDLPSSGSDLDIFIVFNDDFLPEFALGIGMEALKEYDPHPVQAKVKFAEAFFEKSGLKIEVQIVPIKHLELEQIVSRKDSNGNSIEIGMERTPHQTLFMIQNLDTPNKISVKILKQFMKDVGVYDSSIRSQGFSGYIAECLIYELGSFEKVIQFFANFEKGATLGKLDVSKVFNVKFNLADPIDYNRNLIKDTVSDIKIARMIVVSRILLLTGKVKERKVIQLPSIAIVFKSTEAEPEKQGSQINSAIKTIITKLNTMGFEVPVEECNITDNYKVDYPYVKDFVDKENMVTFILGVSNTETQGKIVKSKISLKKGLPEKAIEAFKNANKEFDITETEDELIVMIENDCPTIEKALDKILISDIENSGLPEGIKNDIVDNGVTIVEITTIPFNCLM